ncbi:MAG: hypothetical protein IAI48_00460 [Candidatus Eremiobacteraeota bacterium]|nr:hypothetical protein [Candidatus Eremiobacteraeota bacterium]
MRRLLVVLAAFAMVLAFFSQRPQFTEAQAIPCPSGIIASLIQYKLAICAGSAAPTTTPTPSYAPTAIPTGDIDDSPQALGDIAQAVGIDLNAPSPANQTTFPLTRFYNDLGIRNVRGYTTTPQFIAGVNAYLTDPNTGYCGIVSSSVYDSAATIASRAIAYEVAVTGTSGPGTAGAALIACSIYEGQNEWDNVAGPQANPNPTNTPHAKTQPDTLSTATTGGGATTAETWSVPGSGCSTSYNFYACPGIVLYVYDPTNGSEHVTVSSVSGGAWSAPFQFAHPAGTPVYIDGPYSAAAYMVSVYNGLRLNSTNTELHAMTIGTIPFAVPNNLAALDAAQVASSGQHIWYYADADDYHFSQCNAPPEQSQFRSWSSIQNLTFSGLNGGVYPFRKGVLVTEHIEAASDEQGNGAATNPYVPSGAGSCNLPQNIDATYIGFSDLYIYGLNVSGATQVSKLYEAIMLDNASGNLTNSLGDVSGNYKPNAYALANVRVHLSDDTYVPTSYTPHLFAYPNPAPSDWCTTYEPTRVPSGCTTFHETYMNQAGTKFGTVIQRMPINPLTTINPVTSASYPTTTNAIYPQQAYQCSFYGVSQNAFGQCPGFPAPTPIPTTTPTSQALQPAGITQAQVYTQDTTCDIPTNIEYTPSPSSTIPDATPVPTYTHAANSHCFPMVPGVSYTPNPTGTMVVPYSLNGSAIVIIEWGTGATPLPIVTPIPMRTWLPTPTPFPNGSAWPYNQYRTGVYDPNVYLP